MKVHLFSREEVDSWVYVHSRGCGPSVRFSKKLKVGFKDGKLSP